MRYTEVEKDVFARLDAAVEWERQRHMRAARPFVYLGVAFVLFHWLTAGFKLLQDYLAAGWLFP